MAVKSKTKSTKTSKASIITKYMEHVLLEGNPKSEFAFCKEYKIEEPVFYSFFGSLDALKKQIWVELYTNVETVLFKNKEFESYNSREKLLSFYFTFFELLTANRTYILYALKHNERKLESLQQLSELRKKVISFGKNLVNKDNEEKKIKILKKPVPIVSEAVWLQFLFLLKFWLDDSSAGFEKTDIAIEKSVNTVFDVLDNTPLDSIMDLGKFLWTEKMK